jgi:hypothetical protein
VGCHGENNKIELGKDDSSRRRVQIQLTDKSESILVLFSETFQKKRFPLFLSVPALAKSTAKPM